MLKRTPIQRKSGTLKKTGKIKPRKKSDEEKQEQRDHHEKMWELFNQHWAIKEHKCEQCFSSLWGQNKSLYHHHLLEKSVPKYKHLTFEIENLMLLCGDCHTKVTNGFLEKNVGERTEITKVKFGFL